MELENSVISYLEEWKGVCKSLNIHQGVENNRVREFQNWVAILPILSLYSYDEKDYILSYDSPFLLAKIAIAGMVIIIDDVVDNSSPAIIELFDTNLSNLGKQVTLFANHRLHDNGIRLINQIITDCKSLIPVTENFDINQIFEEFFQLVSQENKVIVDILLGNSVTFEERIVSAGTQGATPAILIDYLRLGISDRGQYETLGNALDSLLALKNSQLTIMSEIQHGEITSPLFVLAAELTGVVPMDMTGDIEWFRTVSSTQEFKQTVKEKTSALYMTILSQLQILTLDAGRFSEGFNLLYSK
jgi:hypothetical protein